MTRPLKWTPFQKALFNFFLLTNFAFFVMSGLLMLAYAAAYYAGILPAEELTDYPQLSVVLALTGWCGILGERARQNQDNYYPEN